MIMNLPKILFLPKGYIFFYIIIQSSSGRLIKWSQPSNPLKPLTLNTVWQ